MTAATAAGGFRPSLAAAVLLAARPVPPPGVDPAAYRRALAEDTFEAVYALSGVEAVLAGDPDLAREVGWPDTRCVAATDPAGVLDALGTSYGAVIAGDAPDLPSMLAGKLFSALEDAPAAVCPAEGGGLVGLAARLPVPGWLRGVGLDDPDALRLLHERAPARAVVVGPGWHRLRQPADVSRLDPGLEGWEATRRLLSAGTNPAGGPRL